MIYSAFTGRNWFSSHLLWRYTIVGFVLILAVGLGRNPSFHLIALLIVIGASLFLIHKPVWGLFLLPFLAVLVPWQISTGTDVSLNAAVLVIPFLSVVWLLRKFLNRDVRIVRSRLSRPLIALLLVMTISLLHGNATWDASVPRPQTALLVQLAQMSIYIFSFLAFWLVADQVIDLKQLRRLVYLIIIVFGVAAVLLVLASQLFHSQISFLSYVPQNLLMIWVAALSISLAWHDDSLTRHKKFGLLLLALIGILTPFLLNREWLGGWMPVLVTIFAVIWFQNPRMRILLLMLAGTLLFLKGAPRFLVVINWHNEWDQSGASRLTIWRSVIELGNRSPIFGLGPVAYRYYHYVKPLTYGGAYWMRPSVSAHNMYIDMFAQLGVAGLICYLWFLLEIIRLSYRTYSCINAPGFARGYGLAAFCVVPGIVAADMLAATSLPYVYNLGFTGFRVSVVSWMLLGGLVVLERNWQEISGFHGSQ